MSRRRFRLSFGFVACLLLGFGGGACSEADGGRCVQDSDCQSGFCQHPGVSTEGGRCMEPGTGVLIDSGSSSTPLDAASDAVTGTGSDAAGANDAASSDAQPATDAADDAAHARSDGASD